jgi:hypothetical protein
MAEGRFIAYYRVSTDKQGRFGLGLEAQRSAVLDYLDGGNWKLIAEHTEIESGKRSDRPVLAKALKDCKLRAPRWSSPSSIVSRATHISCLAWRRPASISSRSICRTPTASRCGSWR